MDISSISMSMSMNDSFIIENEEIKLIKDESLDVIDEKLKPS